MLKMIFQPNLVQMLWPVLALIVASLFLGIFIGIKNKSFDWKKLPDFLVHDILPYMGALLILALLAPYNDEIKALYVFAIGTTTLMFLFDLKDKFKKLFGTSPPDK